MFLLTLAIFIGNYINMTISQNLLFESNSAQNGGGIYFSNFANLNMTANCKFLLNYAELGGGF